VLGDARLLCTAPVDGALAAALDPSRELENSFPTLLPAEFLRHERLDLFGIGIQEQLAAPETDALEDILDHSEKLDVKHRLGEHNVAKVPGTKRVLLFARDANLVVLNDTHAGIKEAVCPRFRSIERIGPVDLCNRSCYDVLWTKHAKLNTPNWINVIFIRELLVHGHIYFGL
jgi:hypothetical protein